MSETSRHLIRNPLSADHPYTIAAEKPSNLTLHRGNLPESEIPEIKVQGTYRNHLFSWCPLRGANFLPCCSWSFQELFGGKFPMSLTKSSGPCLRSIKNRPVAYSTQLASQNCGEYCSRTRTHAEQSTTAPNPQPYALHIRSKFGAMIVASYIEPTFDC